MPKGLLAAIILAPGLAFAQEVPPVPFVRPFAGELDEIPLSDLSAVWSVCRFFSQQEGLSVLEPRRPDGTVLGGCSIPAAPDHCIIVWWTGRPAIREHELAHCNGWKHD